MVCAVRRFDSARLNHLDQERSLLSEACLVSANESDLDPGSDRDPGRQTLLCLDPASDGVYLVSAIGSDLGPEFDHDLDRPTLPRSDRESGSLAADPESASEADLDPADRKRVPFDRSFAATDTSLASACGSDSASAGRIVLIRSSSAFESDRAPGT